MRHPIISDTTRSYVVATNPYNAEPDEPAYGYYVGEYCPVNGNSLVDGPFDTFEAAQKATLFFVLEY